MSAAIFGVTTSKTAQILRLPEDAGSISDLHGKAARVFGLAARGCRIILYRPPV